MWYGVQVSGPSRARSQRSGRPESMVLSTPGVRSRTGTASSNVYSMARSFLRFGAGDGEGAAVHELRGIFRVLQAKAHLVRALDAETGHEALRDLPDERILGSIEIERQVALVLAAQGGADVHFPPQGSAPADHVGRALAQHLAI